MQSYKRDKLTVMPRNHERKGNSWGKQATRNQDFESGAHSLIKDPIPARNGYGGHLLARSGRDRDDQNIERELAIAPGKSIRNGEYSKDDERRGKLEGETGNVMPRRAEAGRIRPRTNPKRPASRMRPMRAHSVWPLNGSCTLQSSQAVFCNEFDFDPHKIAARG